MGNFLIIILLLGILGVLIKHQGVDKEQINSGQITIDSTDLLALLLQLTKASVLLERLSREVSCDNTRHYKVCQLQESLELVCKSLAGRLRAAGVSELAIQQASTVNY